MSDSENGLKWWIRFVIVPLIGGGGLVAILVAVISKPEAVSPTPDAIPAAPAQKSPLQIEIPNNPSIESLSGRWHMWANEEANYEFTLMLQVSSNLISGKMLRDGEPTSDISGRIEGTKISFSRTNPQLKQPQRYDGSIVREGSNIILRGRYDHDGVFEPHAKWEARRE